MWTCMHGWTSLQKDRGVFPIAISFLTGTIMMIAGRKTLRRSESYFAMTRGISIWLLEKFDRICVRQTYLVRRCLSDVIEKGVEEVSVKK
ncbi:uncharacterized protein BDW43DRAFT_175855 [Aspergillus alliaceus]|uniref:uncharacterized protein n=1 Tax=Petromyces alliaceus TaxID=209559 RepID=UPI0012A55C4E|nr:uncharacterized protein BDW43DRAFT_175855 [Aspergillus alliaceus]KAB8229916.1 hypothetical protein BDW43DRAFT_175855 [Aspergillus alliaceus]